VRGVFPESTLRRILYPLTAAVILTYFIFFTEKSLGRYFDRDDMMNLYLAWSKPLGQVIEASLFLGSDVVRPFGALFYRVLYAVFGFNPLPFRIVCLALGAANMALCFRFARLIAGSERVAALATLLFAFHPRLIEVWYRTAVVYDLLCFSFFYLSVCLYIQVRKRGEFPGAVPATAILLCYIGALNSKEVAVALPVILLGYELLFERVVWRKLWLIAVMALLNVPYIALRTHGAHALTINPAYRPEYTYSQFAHSWARYLNYLTVGDRIAPWMATPVLCALLTIALASRSRRLLFAWLVIVIATLPMSFLPYRGGFVLYVSYAGWVLYASLVLVSLQDIVIGGWPRYRTALACVVFMLAGWRFGKLNLHDQRADARHWLYDDPKLVHDMADQMRTFHKTLPAGSHTLFIEDSFATDEWTPYFIMKLRYHDDSLVVDRIKMMDAPPRDWNRYQYVFTYRAGAYRQLKP
jgi:hypothetical protein